MLYARREILKIALSALPMAGLWTRQKSVLAAAQSSQPNSNFGGVQVGIIAPYAFRGTASSAEEILKNMVDIGISAVEMQNGPVEQFAGAPGGGGRRGPGRPPGGRGGERGGRSGRGGARWRTWRTWCQKREDT